MYHVYILLCADNSYYVGVTNNIERRVYEHNSGNIDGYTHTRLLVQLVFSQDFTSINDAIAFEKQVKKWRRSKKEALIQGNVALVLKSTDFRLVGEV